MSLIAGIDVGGTFTDVAVYDTDHLLAPHLLVARQAGARVGAAEFSPLDLRAVARLGLEGVGSA